MQINERDRSILEHMIRYCDEIEEYVARFGDSKEAFDNDNAYRAACSLNILQIGELSSNLTDNFKRQTEEMPWRDIKTMRNVVAHGYGTLDADITWNTLTLPQLKQWDSCFQDRYIVTRTLVLHGLHKRRLYCSAMP